jgi:hypothetical protein
VRSFGAIPIAGQESCEFDKTGCLKMRILKNKRVSISAEIQPSIGELIEAIFFVLIVRIAFVEHDEYDQVCSPRCSCHQQPILAIFQIENSPIGR